MAARLSIDGAVAQLVLDRPAKLNALSDELRRELQAGIDELGERADVRVVVLSGAGDRAFSAGADLVRYGLLAYGLAIVAFAAAPVYLVGLLALVVVGGGFLVVISATNTSVQVIVADHMRGRVMALRIMAFTGAYPVGALVQGSLSDVIGPRTTVAGAGGVLVAAGVWMWTGPAVLHRLDDAHDESSGAEGD